MGHSMNGRKNRKQNYGAFPVKFDREGFFLSSGIGIVTIGIGVLIIWGTLTAPEGESGSTAFTLSQRIARQLPRSFQEWLAFAFSALLIIFGLVCLVLSVKSIFQYLIAKIKWNRMKE